MEPTLYYLFLFFSFLFLAFFYWYFYASKKVIGFANSSHPPAKKKKIGSSHDVTHAYKLVFSKDEFKEISPK
jgi:hypothetical protein